MAFKKVVDWVNTVRERDRDIELFMVPEKARRIAAPASPPLKEVRGELVPADIEPRMVINRRTTDWYLDRLAWDAFYNLGFLATAPHPRRFMLL